MESIVGINGFGRFGLHLLKYWLDRNLDSKFNIGFINDDSLSIDQAIEIIKSDEAVIFNKYKVQKLGDTLRILEPNGNVHAIEYTSCAKNNIPWIGVPDLIFECSGKNTVKEDCLIYMTGKTKHVIISATSWDADKTIVYGFNQKKYSDKDKIISYGSCTVNAFVPLATYINKHYEILDADLNVVHNILKYRIEDNITLNRKFCTLEKSAVTLLSFINNSNFTVNYTVVPYTGVSMIDFRFRVNECPKLNQFIKELEISINKGQLHGLYDIDEVDIGPDVHNCTVFSSVFIKEGIKIINDQIYLFAYFDNENSVNRFYDLADYISNQIC